MAREIFAGREERDGFLLLVADLADEEVEKLRSFIPPMPEQLGVIRRDDDGRAIQDAFELVDLCDAFVEEMPGVLARGGEGVVALVNLLFALAGDAEIFDAGEPAVVGRRQ